LSALRTPAYIARVAVHTPRHVIEAKKAIRKAFQYQVQGRCFSLVEVLSTCPTNWGMTPIEATQWVQDNMVPYFPLGELKVPEEE
jgi:2-oxoglutarate ferredoxin oxidoreductase subunit beta